MLSSPETDAVRVNSRSLPPSGLLEESLHSAGGVALQVGEDISAGIEGEGDTGVSQALSNDFGGHLG